MNKDILFHLFILTFTCYNYVGSCCASNINVDKSLITVFTKYQVSNYLKFEGLSIYEKISTGRKTSIDRNKKIESEGIFKKDDENNEKFLTEFNDLAKRKRLTIEKFIRVAFGF